MLKHDVKIVCVLRRSGAYDVDYVQRLQEQASIYAPGVPFICLANTPIKGQRIQLRRGWPGWWSKLEIFQPEITGDIFFIDLDTIIVDYIWDFLNVRELTMLTDFYRPEGLGSGLMYIPQSARADVWRQFINDPIHAMQKYKSGGDQRFLMSVWKHTPLRWQDVLPGRTISYKAHKVAKEGIAEGVGIVCHHGVPKPRDISWDYPGLRYEKGRWVRK